MKAAKLMVVWGLVFQLSGIPLLLAQPVIDIADPFRQGDAFGPRAAIGMGVENLRVVQQNSEGTEALLTMDYTYDGFAGPVAQLLPVISKKGQRGVSGWFGADPVTVGRGRGTISIKVRYFNDEPGVPPMFTSDQVQILILNQSGRTRLFAVPFLKNIKWGSPNARPAQPIMPAVTAVDAVEAKKLAEEKRDAVAKARAELQAREEAMQKAEALARALLESERRAKEDALAREQARLQAEAEAQRLAEESKRAEEKRLAEQRAREEERLRAEALEKRLAEEKRLADEKARKEAEAKEKIRLAAEAKARQEEQLRAEAETKRLAEERQIAEEKAKAEALAQAEARDRAEREAKRLAEEKRAADEKALAETKARKAAEERAQQEALAKANAEREAQKLNEEKKQAEAIAQAAATSTTSSVGSPPSMELAQGLKTKIVYVDVVSRSTDRTQMTFGIEFEYLDKISDPIIGVDVYRHTQPEASRYFASQPSQVGKSRRNFALLPIKFEPPAGLPDRTAFSTDKVMVYLQDKSGRRYNIFPATMLLLWRAPGSPLAVGPIAGNTVEIDDFRQNDISNGYVSIRYHLAADRGQLRAKVFEAKKPDSWQYFSTETREIKSGPGLQLIEVRVDGASKSPTDIVHADTIQVDLLDGEGEVLATVSKQAPMVWSKPK